MQPHYPIQIPEPHKQPGVYYAVTPDGVEVAVVDLSNPTFVENKSREELARIAEDTIRGWKRSRLFPRFVGRLMARHSLLMRGTYEADGGFVSGMASYYLKLKPELLGTGYASNLDRRITSLIGPTCMRLRMQTIAHYLTDELTPILEAKPTRPLWLINIGGGPSLDSLNTLALLNKTRPDLLRSRKSTISVLDPDSDGPLFGQRCLTALSTSGGPLDGVDTELSWDPYSWSDIEGLRGLIDRWKLSDDVVAVSSEGALFEYGSDDDIKGVISTLRDTMPADCLVTGTYFYDNEICRTMKKLGRILIQPRRETEFTALVDASGWKIDRAELDNPTYGVVLLRKRV